MLEFKKEYFQTETNRHLYPTTLDLSKAEVYGCKDREAYMYKIPNNRYTSNAGNIDFSLYPNGVWSDYTGIKIVERLPFFQPSINFNKLGDITPSNLNKLKEEIRQHIVDLETAITESVNFIDSGVPGQNNLPYLPEGCVWFRDPIIKDVIALPISELYDKFQGLIDKLYAELKKVTSEFIKKVTDEVKKNAEQIINNIAEQKTSMKLQPNITRYQLPSTWIITDKTEVYINGLLISKEMYRIENYELILNDSLSDEADLVIKISLPSTYIEELKNTAKEDIDNYITEKKKELKGDKGTTFKPSIDNLGNLTWSNDDGLPNPPSANIMGPQGKPGVPGRDGEQGLPGKNGEDGKDLTVEVQGTIGMKFDEKLRFLNDVGVKKKGLCYFDKLTNRAFECLNDTDLTVNDIRYFKDISNKHNIDYIAGLFENTKLYDINSNLINDNFFKGKVTKIIGVKIDVEANDFLNSENKLIKFNYKKVMNQCCYANIICTRPTKSHLGSSLENKVFARIQNIDSVEITIGVLNNNKKEKVEIFLVLYGD